MNLLIGRFHPLLENISNDEGELNSGEFVAAAWLPEENSDLGKLRYIDGNAKEFINVSVSSEDI